jgi:leucyl aminopeptidase (aminopeptidase T)
MSDHSLMEIVPGVKTLVDTCAGVKRGERVLIITDTGMDQGIITAFAVLCRDRGAEVVITNMLPVQIPGQAPSDMVCAAATRAHVVFELTKQFIGASKARIDACKAGARWLILCAMSRSMLRADGAVNVDYHAIRPVGEKIAERIGRAKTYRLTSTNGTDIRGSFEGRPGRLLHGITTEPGSLGAPPDIEVGTAPVEGTSNGIAYSEALLLMGPEKVLEEPVKITIKDGMAVRIEGKYAYILQEMMDACDDPNIYNLAEISLGLNPKARFSGIPLETESAVGVAQVAFGNNRGYYGHTDAVAHLDTVVPNVTLYLDDEPIMRDGKLLIAEIPRSA